MPDAVAAQLAQALAQGLSHFSAGRLPQAESLFRQILQRDPRNADALHGLGLIAFQVGRLETAADLFGQAIRIYPGNAMYVNNLGNVQLQLGRRDAAGESFRRALALQPDYPDALYNLGNAYAGDGRLDDAVVQYRRLLALAPDYAEGHYNLGNAWQDQGLLDEAIACYRKAVEIRPQFAAARSNLLLSLQYFDALPPATLRDEAHRYANAIEAPMRTAWPRHTNGRDPARRLKIGYLSADFRRHSVAYFIEPLLAGHHREVVDLHCYYSHPQEDAVTARIKSLADHWLDCHGMNDADLAARIVADGIDILVDLGGHTAHSRIAVFAYKPAPVQVTYLGYPSTTGLGAMDYRLSDVHADPAETAATDDPDYSEKLVRLPRTFLCFSPPADAPAVEATPARRGGHIALGSFNALLKISPATIALWARIMHALPGATLLLKAAGLEHAAARDRLLAAFATHGIDASRLTMLARDAGFNEHLARYHTVDICLDPLPYNGTTTTCEAMWMGVPTITMRGNRHAARVGASLLHNVHLSELIANSEDDYLRIAIALAGDLPRLSALRAGMRGRLEKSPLLDAAGLAADIENAYRQMWQSWCAGTNEPSH